MDVYLLRHLLTFCDQITLRNCTLVCQLWNRIIKTDLVLDTTIHFLREPAQIYRYTCPYPSQRHICEQCVKYGYLESLRYLVEQLQFSYDDNVMIMTMSVGNLEVIRYLIEERNELRPPRPLKPVIEWFRKGAYHGHIECLEYLYQVLRSDRYQEYYGLIFPIADLGYSAIMGDQPNVLKYIVQKQRLSQPWESVLLHLCLREQRYRCLLYLLRQGCPWVSSATHQKIKCLMKFTFIYVGFIFISVLGKKYVDRSGWIYYFWMWIHCLFSGLIGSLVVKLYAT